ENEHRRALSDAEEARRREKLTATLTEQGVRIIDRLADLVGGRARQLPDSRASPDTEPGTELTAARHAGCPGHAAFLRERSLDRWPSGSARCGCAPISQPT